MVASHETPPAWLRDVAICALKLEKLIRAANLTTAGDVQGMLDEILGHLSDAELAGMARWGLSHLAVEVLEKMTEAKGCE